MSDKIYMSLTGGSGLSMQELISCPARFEHKRNGWRIKKKPIYFVSGGIVHECFEKIVANEDLNEIQEKIDKSFGKETPEGFVPGTGTWYDEKYEMDVEFDNAELASKKILKKTGEPSPVTKAQNEAVIMTNIINGIHEQNQAGRFDGIKAIERPVEVPILLNPKDGKPDDDCKALEDAGLVFCGRIDMDEGDALEDLKTASPSRLNPLEDDETAIIKAGGCLERNGQFDPGRDIQLHVYGYFKTIMDQQVVKEVGFHVFSKHKTKCEYYPLRSEVRHKDYLNVFELVKRVGMLFLQYEKTEFPKSGYCSGCKDKYMQDCPYHPLCFPHKYSDIKSAMANLVKGD